MVNTKQGLATFGKWDKMWVFPKIDGLVSGVLFEYLMYVQIFFQNSSFCFQCVMHMLSVFHRPLSFQKEKEHLTWSLSIKL